jgi:ribosomal-protein-alanine N-acetyltransferase
MSTGRARAKEKSATGVHIRWMIRRDMPEVMRTERASFEYAWTEDDFLRCLRQRNCIGMVAEENDHVAGFMIYELHKTRLNVLNFAVHPTVRRLGIGGMLIAKLEYKLISHHRQKITLAVRERNLAPGHEIASQLLRGQWRGRLPHGIPGHSTRIGSGIR